MSSSSTSSESTELDPQGLALAIVVISILLMSVSTIVLILRIWVRMELKAVGMDDYLMIVGWVFFIAMAVVTTLDGYSGLGTKDAEILAVSPTGLLTMNGYKYFWCFQITYVLTLPFIKASICVALLRISNAKRYTYPLWAVIVVSSGTAFAGFVAALMNCKPIAAGWDSSLGSCDQTGTILRLSEVISAAAIVTDWSCAIIPAFLIWGLNMKKQQKLTLCGVLALGVIASISTIIRFPNLRYYSIATDQLYHFGDIVIWTVIECGLGIIAGSLPCLRPLLKKMGFGDKSSAQMTDDGTKGGGRSIGLSTMGRGRAEASAGRNDQWERIDDSSSQKFIIMKNTQVDVEWSAQSTNVVHESSTSDGKSF